MANLEAPSEELRSVSEIINKSYSDSTISNRERAERLFLAFARKHNARDPHAVSQNSPVLLMNFLVNHCRYNTKTALKIDTFGGYVQGLRLMYEKYGHDGTWFSDASSGVTKGNPLTGNPDFDRFRRAYKVNLAKYGGVKIRARPITVEIVCDHAEKFWFGSNSMKLMDIALHSIFVLGLYLGLRFDEITKLQMKNVSIGRQSATLSLCCAIKNSTIERVYEISDWDGNTPLSHSLFLDPFIALYSWISARGNDDGALFPDVVQTQAGERLVFERALSSNKFVSFMRDRLSSIGIGKADVHAYTGHSIKRGCVQLHRMLGYMDEFIMRKLGMVGPNAYSNYCAAYNNDAPRELPRFHSVSHMIEHARSISRNTNWLTDPEAYEQFEKEVWGE